MIRLAVFGAAGRMGTRILELAGRDEAVQVVGALEAPGHPALGKPVLDGKVAVSADLAALEGRTDVLIDFTAPKATLRNLEAVARWKGAALVIGTTGFSDQETAFIRHASTQMPVLISPNMSRGVNVMLEAVRTLARRLSDYDVEIIESHHNQKKDAPSGTALALARQIAAELERGEPDMVYGRKGETGARGKREIGIHAVRGGDIVGDHTVLFASGGERLEITHRAASRDAFAAGALHAAKWLCGKPPGLYGMQDVLKG